MHAVLSLCCALLAASGASACPENATLLTAVGGSGAESSWCVSRRAEPLTFCNAVKACRASGEEMIGKAVFDAMRAAPSGLFPAPPLWWVGLTDALRERHSSKDGWVWMTDGRVTTAADGAGYFESVEPNDLTKQDCVTTSTSDKKLRDAGCNEERMFYCYGPVVPAAELSGRRFAMSQISTFEQPDPGCWIRSHAASSPGDGLFSLLHCASTCFEFGRGDCVGFYWNFARLECIILPYFDAAVPLSFSSGFEATQWRKFIFIHT